MSFTKVAPAGIGTEPGTSIRLGDSLLHSTGLDIGTGTGIGVTIRQHGDATFTGIVTAASFSGDITGKATELATNATGTNLTLSGNLGVGGTVTYEDVSNVDSVGIITARGGIRIGAGTTVGPISGIVTYFGDGSQLTGTGASTGEKFVIFRDQSNPPALSDTGRNIIIGHNAAHKYGNGSATGGNENVFLGYTAGFQQTGGDGNVYVGAGAGANNVTSTGNVYVGQEAGRNATGQDNICLGRFAGNVGGFTGSNNLVFGYNSDPSSANVSNEITLGNANISHFRIPGIGVSFSNNGAVIAGVVTATSFSGSGANLTGINADLVNDTSPQLGGNLDVNTKNIVFGDSSDGSSDDVLVFGSGTDMKVFHDGSNTKFKNSAGRIHIENSAGPIRTQTDNGFFMMSNDGNTVHAEVDSDGLKFNGDTAAANALDDYETGTWTPGASGFTIGSTQSATYTKIGRLVFVQCYLNTASGSGGSTVIITGLPFTVKSGNVYQYATGRLGGASYNNSQHMITFEFTTGNTHVIPKVSDGNINWGMLSGTHVMFSGCYQV